MSQGIVVLFVEDDPADKERYSRLLTETGKITVNAQFAPERVNELPLDPPLALVLIDYRLTDRQPSGVSAPYRGGTLATYVAEQLPEIPIAILSTRSVLNLFPNYEDQIQAADYVLYKEDIHQDPGRSKAFLMTVVNGFRQLIGTEPKTWDSLMQLLQADSSEEETLQRSAPPRERESWSVHGVAKWVSRILFRYPGILYDSLYASASLGISEASFLREEAQSLFEECMYKGVFANMEQRWWRNRLQRQAFRCIREKGLEPVLSENFRTAFEYKTGVALEPAICVYSGERNADTICYILRKPVKMKYTLGYLPDDRPEAMEPARISFKAVLEEDIDPRMLPKEDAERLDVIRRADHQ